MEQKADTSAYYGYLFEDTKEPTKVLDALLRGIANYIIEFIGDKDIRYLSPPKLAAFYKAVGGNYDALFVDVPNPNISYIYQSIGCQHTLQPTTDDFAPPSIPALTIRGFVRWESIETLLGPEEHVPFLQAALQNFPIKHPDTGEPFPVDLPKDSFPLQPDPEIERWHQECGEKLRRQANPDDDYSSSKSTPPHRSQGRSTYYVRVRPPSPTREVPPKPQENTDYFPERSFARHVPARTSLRANTSHESNYQAHLSPDDNSNPEDSPRPSGRRRYSVPDNGHNTSRAEPTQKSNSPHREIRSTHRTRRHSHPHNEADLSASSSSESDEQTKAPTSPTSRTQRPRVYFQSSPKLRFESPSTTPPLVDHSPTSTSRRFRDIDVAYGRSATYKIPADSPRNSVSFTHAPRHAPPLRSNSRISIDALDDPRDRERSRRDEWPRLVKVRSGSHDGRYHVREPDRRDRDREWEMRSDRSDRGYERRRTRRRTPSPARTGWRRFVPGLN